MPNPGKLPLSISGHYRVPQKQKGKKEIAFFNGTMAICTELCCPGLTLLALDSLPLHAIASLLKFQP